MKLKELLVKLEQAGFMQLDPFILRDNATIIAKQNIVSAGILRSYDDDDIYNDWFRYVVFDIELPQYTISFHVHVTSNEFSRAFDLVVRFAQSRVTPCCSCEINSAVVEGFSHIALLELYSTRNGLQYIAVEGMFYNAYYSEPCLVVYHLPQEFRSLRDALNYLRDRIEAIYDR